MPKYIPQVKIEIDYFLIEPVILSLLVSKSKIKSVSDKQQLL